MEHWASPVSQEYVPESPGSRLWMRRCWRAPFLLRSYLGPALTVSPFLTQVTVASDSEMVQERVTVSPSRAVVLWGFSRIRTGDTEKPVAQFT